MATRWIVVLLVACLAAGGGYYYWDAGYWYPAWGYDPAFSVYVYDGPIYSYANLPPDQVIVNVQTELQDQGYYIGEIDGQLGPKPVTHLALIRPTITWKSLPQSMSQPSRPLRAGTSRPSTSAGRRSRPASAASGTAGCG